MASMLTEKQRAFVQAYVAVGGTNAAEAARQAGYPATAASQAGWRLLQDPKILQAIKEECQKLDQQDLPMARGMLRQILLNPAHEKHFDALKWYFGVLGISPVTKSESKKVVEHTTNLGALEELKMLAAQLRGLPAPGAMIDVTPTVEEWSAHD